MSGLRRIYVDFDDVLSETARAIAAVVETMFRKQVPFEDLHYFDLDKSFGLSRGQLEELMSCLHDPRMLLEMDAMPAASDSLGEWTAAGYEVCVVTGRPPSTAAASEEWLKRHGILYTTLLFVDKYGRSPADFGHHRVLGLDEFRTHRFCLAVEDSPDMAEFLASEMSVPVALMSRPWNAGRCVEAERAGRLVRCRDWVEVLRRFPAPAEACGSPAASCA
jgi:uncharacterized HAD superfamily protein